MLVSLSYIEIWRISRLPLKSFKIWQIDIKLFDCGPIHYLWTVDIEEEEENFIDKKFSPCHFCYCFAHIIIMKNSTIGISQYRYTFFLSFRVFMKLCNPKAHSMHLFMSMKWKYLLSILNCGLFDIHFEDMNSSSLMENWLLWTLQWL